MKGFALSIEIHKDTPLPSFIYFPDKNFWIVPIATPVINRSGENIQLWSFAGSQLFASVQKKDKNVVWISPQHIRNGLDPNQLVSHNQIISASLLNWTFVFKNLELFIWPQLKAAGWKDAFPRPNGDLSGIVHLAQKKSQGEMGAWFYSNGYQVSRANRTQVELLLNGQSAGIVQAQEHQLIRNFLMNQKGASVSLRFIPDPPSSGETKGMCGRGIEFTHPRCQNLGSFNIDLSTFDGHREQKGGYHIDVLSPYLKREEKKVSTKETYEANRTAQANGKDLPYKITPEKSSKDTARLSDPTQKGFQQTLQQTGLVKSYNSAHPNHPIPEKGMVGADIGGVACTEAYINNLFNDPSAPFIHTHYFCFANFENNETPFTNSELKQILRELAIGIYVHNTIPFFSLHFQEKGTDLFSVIHPAYANTLVGRVIGMLDYIMKGYLNGGVYQQDFIDSWHQNPDWNAKESSALDQLIEFKKYCQEKMVDEDRYYISLSSLKDLHETEDVSLQEFQSLKGFKNAFRIIAKQKKVEKSGPLLLISSDFKVEYDIHPTPLYQQFLEQYIRQNGAPPPTFVNMENFYATMAQKIHDHMSKMPLCRKYFSQLFF